jgi:hypothetical protein
MMNILKRFFHRHDIEDVACPYTMKTYFMCKKCGQKMGWRLTGG